VPQLIALPQPSPAGPHAMFCTPHDSGTHVPPSISPHCPDVPAPPQVSPAGQVPQLIALPHPSPAGPQPIFCTPHDRGTHAPPSGAPHCPEMPPPPQVSPVGQVPHSIALPHPSPAGPQPIFCTPHDRGTHAPPSGAPHCPGTPPPPQVCPAGQVPQFRAFPQPSPAGPHSMFWALQDRGEHAPPSGAPQ
jgi:hypothetical protein